MPTFRKVLSTTALAGLLLTGIAQADVFTFDTSLASPDTNAANTTNNLSWYNGSGNAGVQGGWTVDNASGIEVGLRVKNRQANSTIDTPNDDYQAPAGPQPGSPTHAAWNYEFSIDLQPNGVGALTIGDIVNNTTLTVNDLTTGASNTVNLFSPVYAPDDSGFGTTNGTTGANRIDESSATLAAFEAGWGAQNSENPEFANWPLASLQAFNPYAHDTYQFILTVVTNGGTVLATDDIEVSATPEPEALLLLATAVAGVLLAARRKKSLA